MGRHLRAATRVMDVEWRRERRRSRESLGLVPRRLVGAMVTVLMVIPGASATAQPLDSETAHRFARLALDCVHREYPNKISHVLHGDEDARPPRALTPAFFGCYDWHSSVHAHWLLVRLTRFFPNAEWTEAARGAVGHSLTAVNIAAETHYLADGGRASFERPYGLAWLFQLAAELREWDDAEARRWRAALSPLEMLVVGRFKEWLPKLTHPIRSGEHSQTAFSFGLMLDWARTAHDEEMRGLLRSSIDRYYASDQRCPMAYEPSGQDFLSPCLAEADLMRRVQDPATFAHWLEQFLPTLAESDEKSPWLSTVVVSDPTDGKLAHLDGLNLSRAWMLEGIISGLPPDDDRRATLAMAARRHRLAGLESVTGEHYEGGHWLASFATYLVTQRGLR